MISETEKFSVSDLKPYPEYKPSQVPWLGLVPIHWSLERAKNLLTKMDRPVRDSDEVVTCFRDGIVTLRKNRRLTGFTEAIYEFGYQGIRRGDLIIHAMDAFAGAIGVSDSDGKGTPVYAVCQPKSGINAHYYAFIVREMARTQWILALSRGIRERSTDFRYNTFGGQTVPLPPPDEQASIVRFLDWAKGRLERAVRAKRKVIALLNEQKQAIIYRAITRGLDTSAPLKSSGIRWLGDIPEHWESWQIRHFAKVGNGSTPSRGNSKYWENGIFPWLNSASVNQGSITVADQYVTDLALRECHLPIVPADSILVAITGQGKTRGTAALLTFEATINQHMAYISPRKEKVCSDYLQMFLIASYSELRRISTDSGSTKGALTCDDVKHFRVALPPIDEQKNLVRFLRLSLKDIEATLARMQLEIGLLQELQTRLIADVVTGKLDVRDTVAQLPREHACSEYETELSMDDEVTDEECLV